MHITIIVCFWKIRNIWACMYIRATAICYSTDFLSDSHCWKAIELEVLDHKMLHIKFLDGTVVLSFAAYALWSVGHMVATLQLWIMGAMMLDVSLKKQFLLLYSSRTSFFSHFFWKLNYKDNLTHKCKSKSLW